MNTKVTASLGAGSFDYDALKEKTNAAIAGDHADAETAKQAVQDAVADADKSGGRETDPRQTPGYKFETRKRKIGGELVAENIQVADPGKPAAVEARPARASRRTEAEGAAPTAAPAEIKE